MFTLFLAHIIITGVCFWLGYLFYQIILRKPKSPSIIFCLLTGLVVLTLITQVLVLFLPLNKHLQLAEGILLLTSVGVFQKNFRNAFRNFIIEINQLRGLFKVVLGILWLIILFINSGPTLMDDTESYHIQMIKWIQEYGTVPGLVNLHERYGFNSSWFSSAALFSNVPGSINLFTGLNGVLSMWFCFYLVTTAGRLQNENKHREALSVFIVLTISLLIWPLLRGNAATSNYDFITTVMVFILFTETFLSKSDQKFPQAAEWILWPAYLFTVRIINYPLLLLTLPAWWQLINTRSYRKFFLYTGISLLLVLPFLTRNVILSGYPFYPAPYFNWFAVDWKADAQLTQNLLEYIKYYNRVSTTFLDIEQTKALGAGWVPSWFHYLFWHDKLLVIMGILGLITGWILLVKKKSAGSFHLNYLLTALIVFILSWFIISPDPRFIYGCLLTGTFLLGFYSLKFFGNGLLKKMLPALLLALIAVSPVYVIKKIIQNPPLVNWLLPQPLPVPPVTQVNVNGIRMNIPEKVNNNWNARCYATPLPCLYEINPKLKPRGKSIQQGFRLEK